MSRLRSALEKGEILRFPSAGHHLGNKDEETSKCRRLKLNCARPSYEAIKNEQLEAIDNLSFKETRLFGEKAVDLFGNALCAISLINPVDVCVVANG